MTDWVWTRTAGRWPGVEEGDRWGQHRCYGGNLVGVDMNYLAGHCRKQGRWNFAEVGYGMIECLLQVYNLGGWQAFLAAVGVEGDQLGWGGWRWEFGRCLDWAH